MKNFKVWLEDNRNQFAVQKNYFDQVMRILQATEDDLSRPLDQLNSIKTPNPQDGEAQPPPKGKNSLLKVNQLLGDILQNMSKDREDTNSSVRASRTMELLRNRSSDGRIQPVMFLQDLLRELFGNDFHEEFIKNKPSQDNTPMPKPDDNASIDQNQDQPDLNDPTQSNPSDQNLDQEEDDPLKMQVPPKKPFGGNNFV